MAKKDKMCRICGVFCYGTYCYVCVKLNVVGRLSSSKGHRRVRRFVNSYDVLFGRSKK